MEASFLTPELVQADRLTAAAKWRRPVAAGPVCDGAVRGGRRGRPRMENHRRETPMIDHELLQVEGILVLRPKDRLEASDFEKVAQEVDPYIDANGKLHGILLDAEAFPGWKDFAALVAHLKFVRDHHRKIEKIAVVSDSTFLSVAPRIASHFVQADLRHFPHAQREAASAWLRGEN
jgi:hypothetical protein